MHFLILGAKLAMLATAMANPLAEPVRISKRNPCDDARATPQISFEYRGEVCPPINTIDSDGSCPGFDQARYDCTSFCQVRTTFVYGTEIPFLGSYCHKVSECSIAETSTVTVTGNSALTPEFLKALDSGISGGFNNINQTVQARAWTVQLDPGSCGYFSFIPVRKDICGTMTSASIDLKARRGCGVSNSIGNYCASEFRRKSDGTVDGDTIFVKIDCDTRQPLPMEEQDEVYKIPGVQMDSSALSRMLSTWCDALNLGSVAATLGHSC